MDDRASDSPSFQHIAVVKLERASDRIALWSAYAAAGCLAALVLLVLGQVACGLLSKVIAGFPSDIPVGWEYGAYLMGTSFMLGGALTLRAGMQIRVELLLRAFDGRFLRPLNFLAAVLGAAFVVFLAWSLSAFAFDSFTSGQVSGESLTPLWIPQATLAFGTIIFALQCVMQVIACMFDRPLINDSFRVASTTE